MTKEVKANIVRICVGFVFVSIGLIAVKHQIEIIGALACLGGLIALFLSWEDIFPLDKK